MDVLEAVKERNLLRTLIWESIDSFEEKTGCRVEEVRVRRAIVQERGTQTNKVTNVVVRVELS